MYYAERYTVSSHDVDVNNNIKPSNLLRFMQETANRQMRDSHPSYEELFFSGKSFIITRVSIEAYQQIHQYQDIEVRCWVCEGKAATFIRCYQIWRGKELCANAYSEWALTDMKTGGLVRTTDVDFSSYETDEVLKLDLPKRFRIPKDLELKKLGTEKVLYSNVDLNGHMNNTYYPDMLWNFIPDIEEKAVTSLNIRYAHAAMLNTEVEIRGAEADSSLSKDPRAQQTYVLESSFDGTKNVEAVFGLRDLEDPLWDEEQLRELTHSQPSRKESIFRAFK